MYIRFGEICRIVMEVRENRETKDDNNKKQEDILNYLLRACLAGEIPENLEEYTDAYDPKYKADMATRLIQGKDSLNNRIITFLQKSFREERLELIRDYIVQADSMEETDVTFPVREVAYKVLELYKKPSFNIAPQNKLAKGATPYLLNFDYLDELYQSARYDDLFALLLFYAVAYISNKIIPLSRDIAKDVSLSENMLMDINHGKYYEKFERSILIIPDKNSDHLDILTTTSFSSPFLKPKEFKMDSYSHFYQFETEENRSRCSMEKFIINGVDYTNSVEVRDSTDTSKGFIYRRTFILKNVPRQKNYDVSFQIRSIRSFPAYHMSYRLPVPCRHFYNKIEIKGFERDNWRVGMKMFAPVSFGKDSPNKHETPPNTNLQCVSIDEWIPAKSGYYVYARPKHEFWREYIDGMND